MLLKRESVWTNTPSLGLGASFTAARLLCMQAEDTEKVRALELKRLKEQLRQEFEKETLLLRKAQEQDKAAEAVKAMLLAEVNNEI